MKLEPSLTASAPAGRSRVSTALVAATGVALAVVSYRAVEVREERLAEAEFQRRAQERLLHVERAFDHAVHAIGGLADLHAVSPDLTPEEFRTFARPLLQRNPSLRAVGRNPWVAGNALESHEAATRALGIEGYRVTERGPEGLVPVAPREAYVAVQFIEPLEGNEAALGFDILSEPVRREALLRARETREVATTGRVELVQETGSQYGVLLCWPLFGPGGAVPDGLLGFMVGVFRVGDVVEGAVGQMEPVGLRVELEDLTAAPADRALHRWEDLRAVGSATGPPRLVADHAFPFGGRRWLARAVPTSAYVAGSGSPAPELAFAVILAMTAMVVAYIGRLTHFNARLQKGLDALRAAEAQLAVSEDRYRTLVEGAPLCIVELDHDGRVLAMNDPGVALVGREGSVDDVSFLDLVAAEDRDRVRGRVEDVLRGVPGSFEFVLAGGPPVRHLAAVLAPLVDETGEERRAVGYAYEITDRKRAEDRQARLVSELDHRVKNTLAVVLALCEETREHATSLEHYEEALRGRIQGMARAHEALARARWDHADLEDVLRETFAPIVQADAARVAFEGDAIDLPPHTVLPLALAVNELATNALKYGALAAERGQVRICWEPNPEEGVRITWSETGGDPVTAPDREGFGLRLVRELIEHDLGGHAEPVFRPEGFACELVFPFDRRAGGVRRLAPSATLPARPAPAVRSRRVLVVEDDRLQARMIGRLLERLGWEVVALASTVDEGLAAVRAEPVDLAVLDYDLGGTPSVPIALELSARARPFLFLTGFAEPAALPAELADVPRLQKPFDPAVFEATVDALVKRFTAPRPDSA